MQQYQTDEERSEKQDEQKDDYEEILKFLEKTKQQVINKESLENKTVVFLLGNTRVGKSTLFHLLQGDKLVRQRKNLTLQNQQKTSLIGHLGLSFTKVMNYFVKREQQILIVDTPGLYDTNDSYDEVISQITLAKMLNRCNKENCKDMLFLIVVKHDEGNYNEIQETIKRIQENFTEDLLPHFLKKFRLILTRSLPERNEMNESMEIIFNQINTNSEAFKNNKIINHFLDNNDQIIYFPETANEEQQQTVFNQIYDFINSAQNNQFYPLASNKNLKFFMSISDKGFLRLRSFLDHVKKFYNNELAEIYQQISKKIESINELQVKYRVCKQFQNIQETPLYLQNLPRFIHKLEKVSQVTNIQNFPNTRLETVQQIFTEGWMETILQFESKKRYFEYCLTLQMDQNFEKIKQLSIISAEQLQKHYQIKNKNNSFLLDNMMKIHNYLQNHTKDWSKMIVVIGNRQSGKSSIINLIYQKMFSNCIIIPPSANDLQGKPFNPDFIVLEHENHELIIEFQEFNFDCLPFMQFLFQNTTDENKQFNLYVVFDQQSKSDCIVYQALQTFIQINQFSNLEMINCFVNIKSGITCPENYNEYIPDYIKNISLFKEMRIVKVYKVENQLELENRYFQIKHLEFSFYQGQIRQPKNIKWFESILKEIFYDFSQILDQNISNIWQKTNQIKEFQQLLQLSELTPNTDHFQEKIKDISRYFQLNPLLFQCRYQQLQELHKKLIEQNNIIQLIENALQFIDKAKQTLEESCFSLAISQDYNLRLELEIMQTIRERFPILSNNDVLLNEKIQFLDKIAKKINQKPNIYNPNYHNNYEIWKKLKYQGRSNLQNLVWQLLQQINNECSKLKRLLELMLESQHENFKYSDENVFVKFYQSVAYIFKTNTFKETQNQLESSIKKSEKIKTYKKLEDII